MTILPPIPMNTTFTGEIEFTSDSPDVAQFSTFEALPHVDLIFSLASECEDSVELMPYQAEGGDYKLMIAIYLTRPDHSRFIIVLKRDDYPNDLADLITAMKSALQRIEVIIPTSDHLRFTMDSLETAKRNIEVFIEKITALKQ